MQSYGINWFLVLAQVANLVALAAWLTLLAVALRRMRCRDLPETARAIWAALILLLPIVGALAFLATDRRAE